MAVTYGFYDSLNHDRLYNAQQMSAIFDGIINDGVFMSVGNQFHTVAGTGMQVIVKSGRAWFDSTWTLNDAECPLSIDAADVLLTRIDAVVLEVNSEVATRANTIKVVKGTPASTPAKPTLTNTATIHQHALAYVTVAKNTTAITNSMIEIVVGKTETPYVTAILQTTDISDLFNKWENDFQVWFETVKGTLDGDVALNLQNQIDHCVKKADKATSADIEAGTADKWVDANLYAKEQYKVGDVLLTARTGIDTRFKLANGAPLYPNSKLFEMKSERNDSFVLCGLPTIPSNYNTQDSVTYPITKTYHYFTEVINDYITTDRYYVELIATFVYPTSSSATPKEEINIIAYKYNVNTDIWETYSTISSLFSTNDDYSSDALDSISTPDGIGAINGYLIIALEYHRDAYTHAHHGIRIIKPNNDEYVMPSAPKQYRTVTLCKPVLTINNTYYALLKRNAGNEQYQYTRMNITDSGTVTYTLSTVSENPEITPVSYEEKGGYYIGKRYYNSNVMLYAIDRTSFSTWVKIGYYAYDTNYTVSRSPLIVYNSANIPYVMLGYSSRSMLNSVIYTNSFSGTTKPLNTLSAWAFPIAILKENNYYLYVCADRKTEKQISYDEVHVYKFNSYPTYDNIINKPDNIIEMPDTPMIKFIKKQSSKTDGASSYLYMDDYIYKDNFFIVNMVSNSDGHNGEHSGYIVPSLSFNDINAFIKIN